MKESIVAEILIGIFACFIAVFIITKSLQGMGGWTGLAQEREIVVTAPQFRMNGNQVRRVNFVNSGSGCMVPVALGGANLKKSMPGKEFTRFGITSDMFIEGHWWGMEVENLTPLARQILKVPPEIKGLWVDETNLWAVRSGINGADIILKISGVPVRDLGEFYQLTKRFRNRKKVTLNILRGDKSISVVLSPGPPLGIAAMESADALDPLTSDAAVDPLDLTEEAPPNFPAKGYKTLVSPNKM